MSGYTVEALGSVVVPVAVVTDSTAYLPAGLAAERGIRVVPLEVRLGDRSGRDGTDIGPAELVTALADKTLAVHTSRPTPAAFEAVYREALAAGATGVVSVHLSRELSGTWDAARLAAEEVGAVIGAHAGQGLLGIVVVPRRAEGSSDSAAGD